MSTDTLQEYIQKMKRLRVDRAHGVAPHKPLLLLAIIELIERGQIRENKIPLTPDLAEVFIKYWSRGNGSETQYRLAIFPLKKRWILASPPKRWL